ncbi:hypothetical protein [Trinickia diaoshuihuensis]|uniref:hypothetical protein n=1 Tax=Trinickia diaoshuihuensis TaxID=2292265 RepID=UPI000E271BF4|nr:hypothetical protein [Trinickia diaoshuihuensis]
MDRRTFLTASLAAAAGWAWPQAYCLAAPCRAFEPTLFVVDSALPGSRSYMTSQCGEGARYLAAGSDMGVLWYERLCDWRGPVKGVLRPSDCFVLRNLSLADGRAWRSMAAGADVGESSASARVLAFEIGPMLRASRL